jgi:hypothetical protein
VQLQRKWAWTFLGRLFATFIFVLMKVIVYHYQFSLSKFRGTVLLSTSPLYFYDMISVILWQVPLNVEIRQTSDAGSPIVASAPTSEASMVYRGIAVEIAAKLKDWVSSGVGAGPRITIE